MSTIKTNIETEKELVPKSRFKEFDDEWATVTLFDLSENVSYGMNAAAKAFDGIHKYLRITDIDEDSGTFKPRPLTSPEGEISEKFKLKKDDIVFTRTGASVGKPYLYNETDGDLYYAGFLIKFSLTKGDSYFIYSLTQKESYNRWVHVYSMRSGQPGLNAEEYKALKLTTPSLPEQQKIASFLSAVDEKIQQLTKKKDLLEQYKKGVMQQLFSGELRFKDENGNSYPDWEEKRLGDVCTNISYGMNAAAKVYDGENKYLRITDIDEFSNKLNTDKLTSPNGVLDDKFRVREGDILLARTGASVGKSYLYQASDGVLYFAGFLIRFHVDIGDSVFIILQTLTSRYDKWIKVMSMRSGQPGINAEEYKTFQISFPCIEEQQKIAKYLSGIDAKIESVKNQITQTQIFKKGLLQQMFV